jgi:hypothetical protein
MNASSGQSAERSRSSGPLPNRGRIERPSILGGTGKPAASSSVGGRSTRLTNYRRIGQRIHAIAGQLHPLALPVIQHRIVSVRGEFEQIRAQP